MLPAPAQAAAFAATFAPADPLAPQGSPAPVQKPGGAEPTAPVVQRPGGALGDALSPGTAAPTTEPAPTSSTAPASTPATPAVRVGASRRPTAASQVGVVEAPAGGPKPRVDGMPRYYQAPFSDAIWPDLLGREVLMVMGSGARACVTLSKKTPDALFYTHRTNGKQQAPLSAVTSLHESSWECKAHDSTPSEWARSGAAVGLGLSGLGLIMGALYDVDHDPRREAAAKAMGTSYEASKIEMPHFVYSVIGITTTTLGTPVVAIGGASTSRDLRVQGKIWARATGWTLYSAATLLNILWLVGFYGEVEGLQRRGLTTGAGVLGLGGSAFMAVDALMSRQELVRLRREDSQRRPTASRARGGLRIGATPIGQAGHVHGMSFGIGGRF